MTAREQCRGDIEPDEAGAAENQDSHFSIPTHLGGQLTTASHQNSARDPYPPPNVRLVSPPRRPRVPGSGRSLLRPNACRPRRSPSPAPPHPPPTRPASPPSKPAPP